MDSIEYFRILRNLISDINGTDPECSPAGLEATVIKGVKGRNMLNCATGSNIPHGMYNHIVIFIF